MTNGRDVYPNWKNDKTEARLRFDEDEVWLRAMSAKKLSYNIFWENHKSSDNQSS